MIIYGSELLIAFKDLGLSFALQFLSCVGIIIIFGLILAFLNKAFYKLAGRKGRTVCYITGVVGTPIHELGHAIMCVIFRHKIKEIRLFQIDSVDGVLGYVRHSYNKEKVWQRIGCFFIGIGPILFGCAILLLLAFVLVNDMFHSILGIITTADKNIFMTVWDILRTFFSFYYKPWWWLFLFFGISISLHMNLSKADIASSKLGIGLLTLVLFGMSLILWLISGDLLSLVTGGFAAFGYFLFCVLLLSVIFSLSFLVLGLIIYVFDCLFNRKRTARYYKKQIKKREESKKQEKQEK